MDRLLVTLDDLWKTDISKVTEPTAWMKSIVVTERESQINQDTITPLTVMEEVLRKLAGKMFMVLDEKPGYW